MSSLAAPNVETIRSLNQQIAQWIDYLEHWDGAPSASNPLAVLSEMIISARQRGLEAAQSDEPGLELELGVYQNHLLRLQRMLPEVYRRLLAQRTLLEQERGRLRVKAEWMDRVKTLR